MTRRRLRLAGFAALGAFMTSACSTDPTLWNAMATGLTEVAGEMAWENANCHWGPMPGARHGPARRYCPGDYGYAPPVALPPSYYKRRDRDHEPRGHGRGRRD